ncbi:MAG: prephenate dehydrogenase [Bacilli bacterium]
MKNVYVIGLGLIGGSLALSLKKHPDTHVVGYDIDEQRMELAVSLGVIDERAQDLARGASDADLIVLGVPVGYAKELLHQMTNWDLKPNVIVTDVGSTKQGIMEASTLLQARGVTFIGGHPMAGSHKSGVSAARAHLFENAYYVLTPSPGEWRTEELVAWLKPTGAKTIVVDAARHDALVGAVSHFPHIVAASLVHTVEREDETDRLTKQLAAGGFRDITRIASSSPVMWRDILLDNRAALLKLLDDWSMQMAHVRDIVSSGDADAIYDFFGNAKRFRDELPERGKGAIPNVYELSVDVPDYAGAIADVTRLLADHRISITNLRILEVREDIFGVLVIRFRNERDRTRAAELLTEAGFSSFVETS